MGGRLREERGGVVVMVALFLPVLVLVMAYVVDVSSWWTHKRHLQLQADAAVLAGAGYFNECFAGTNGNPLSSADADMQAEANKYGGIPGWNPENGAPGNVQVGGTDQ